MQERRFASRVLLDQTGIGEAAAAAVHERDAQPPEWQSSVAAALTAALHCWPKLPGNREAFERHDKAMEASPEVLAVHGKELYLAFECGLRDRNAIEVLESEFLRRTRRAVAEIDRSGAFIDEVQQQFRERLLLSVPPAIWGYSAAGPLDAWLRVAAVRIALNVKKAELRWHKRSSSSGRPEALDVCENHCHPIIQRALDQAVASLAAADREVLRLFYFERWSLESLATRQGVHRATVARWLGRLRQALFVQVSLAIQTELELSACEAQREIADAFAFLELGRL